MTYLDNQDDLDDLDDLNDQDKMTCDQQIRRPLTVYGIFYFIIVEYIRLVKFVYLGQHNKTNICPCQDLTFNVSAPYYNFHFLQNYNKYFNICHEHNMQNMSN